MSVFTCCKSRKPPESLKPQPHSLSISQQPLPTPSPDLDLNIGVSHAMNAMTPVRSSTTVTKVAPDTIELVARSSTAPNHSDATSIRGPISAANEKEVGLGGWNTATSIRSEDANALVTPSVYSNILVHTAEAPAPLLRTGLKTILNLINETADAFPPLKSATGGLLGLIDIMETTAQNQQDRADLEQKLVAVCSILQSQRDHSSASTPFIRRIDGLSTAIHHQISVIRNQNERNLVRRAAENQEDAEEIVRAYRTLSCLFDAFQMDTTMSTERTTEEILSHALLEKLPRVKSAEYNSFSPTQRNGCMEKTREAILAGLMSWATDVTNTKIYWLNGMAGTGKTTIAYSFAEILDNFQMLGATFFCSRLEDDARNVSRIFPSIAFQMAVRFPSMRHALVDVTRRDPDAGHRSLRRQFSDLIVTPLKLGPIKGTAGVFPIIIIDALDECANENMVVDMLSIISQYASTLPVKFFITSRPEQNIRFRFNRQDLTPYSKFILHDVGAEIVNADIGIYMRNRLADIAHERYGEGILDRWPSELQFETLIHHADKLFIYASTVCDYISKGDNVKRRLEAVTQGNLNGKTETLDGLYGYILHAAYTESDDEERPDIEQVLRVVTSALSPLSVKGISDILHIDTSRVTAALSPLYSVVYVPSNSDHPVSTFHASFSDYIHERKRSGDNFLDPSKSHRLLALQCFETMQMSLKENICHLQVKENSPSPITQISTSTIAENISEGLAYACTHWVSHVVRATLDLEDDATDNLYYERVRQLFDHDLLHWIECMSLLGRLDNAISALRLLEMCQWAKTRLELRLAAIDARRFISESSELLSNYCLETYGSALVWLPERSQIRRLYADRRKSSWKITCGLRKGWSVSETTLTPGLSDPTNCAAFSPDGTRLVSVSHDNLESPRVWNTTTGTCEAELKGHSDSVTSILFSPDGDKIVSASFDKSLRIWNTVTGKCEAELTGHSDWVIVVVFSPDGTYVLSASHDKLLRVWNTRTGECKATLVTSNKHPDWLSRAVFSPDATRLAVGSLNNVLKIYNTTTGECEAELKGHSGSITSVVFSPDGTCLVSASHDESLRIWNTATGKFQAELRGHSDSVTSIAFSPDGSQLVSASYDKSLRVWDRIAGKCQAEMKGHSGPVTSAVFSPDASRVISASYDKSLRIWNTVTGECEEELGGHSGPVTSVTHSRNGTRILSTSHDQSLRIWDMATGKCEGELRGHPGSITSVAFSPDGTRLVSASYDNSLRIWNTVTGKCEAVFSTDGICTSAPTSYDKSLQMDGWWVNKRQS